VKNKMAVMLLLTAGAVFAQVSLGVRIGAPPAVRVQIQPRSPGDGYSWITGYWYPVGNHYKWHDGYWTRPAYSGARWVEPRHDGERYYDGYWDGERGHVAHDHRTDHDRRQRDFNHDQDHHDQDHHDRDHQ